MPAKPVVFGGRLVLAGVWLFAVGAGPVHAKPPLPAVLLYPASTGDVPAMADLRTRLRLDGVFQVLSYDPDSASVKRAAAESGHAEWLVGSALSDDQRLALARALGVAFYAVVSPGRETDGTHLQLVETAPPALTFDWYGVNRQLGARALESQAQASLSHAAPDLGDAASVAYEEPTSLPTAPIAAAPVAAAPIAAAPASPPVLMASAPPPAPLPTPPAPAAASASGVETPPPAVPPSASAPIPLAAYVPSPDAVAIVLPKPAPRVAALAAVAVPMVSPSPPVVVASVPPPAPLPTPPAPGAAVPEPVPDVRPTPPAFLAAKPVVIAPTAPVAVTDPVVLGPPPVPVPPTAPKETQMAMLPPAPALPPEPVTPTEMPAPVAPPRPKSEDLSAIAPLMTRGDADLEGGDVVEAISLFRQAVNGAPLSVVPRLRLAQAYQKGGLTDKALDEAKRALEVAPDSLPVQQFLTEIDTQNGTSDGALTRYRALIERDPQDSAAHSGLAEALWDSGDLPGAEAEYKTARTLAPPGDHAADAHLAQLYATQARYADCLAALGEAGKDGYALAIKIVRNRADTLSSTMEASRDAFTEGKSTREQFYDGAKKVSAQTDALAGFVAQVTPPAEYKLSHLHRILSTNLLAQEASTLVAFIETGDAAQSDRVAKLDKDAQTEMLTAQATEEKLGLWEARR